MAILLLKRERTSPHQGAYDADDVVIAYPDGTTLGRLERPEARKFRVIRVQGDPEDFNAEISESSTGTRRRDFRYDRTTNEFVNKDTNERRPVTVV